MDSFFYCLTQGIKNLRRNRLFSIASIATMTVCLFLFGIMYFLLVNVRFSLTEMEKGVGATVFFKENITYEELVALRDKILDVDGVRYVNNAEELVSSLTSMNKGLGIGAVVLIVLLLAIALFLISTTVSIGVSVRAREIQIQSLIGATDLFIRAPFLVEGVLIGLLGAAIPLSVLYAVYYKLVALISDNFGVLNTINFVPVNEVFGVLIPISLCIGVGIGFFGSSFTLNRELRKFRRM